MTTYVSEVLYLRSIDRSLGSASSYNIILPKTFSKIVSVSLISAEIPYSWGNLTASYAMNARFTQVAPTTVVADYSVPVGNYTITDIQAHLLAWLQASFPALAISAVNYSSITGRLSVVIGNGSGALSCSRGNEAVPRLCSVLGIDATSTTLSVNSDGVNALWLPNVANLHPQPCLLIKMQNIPGNISCSTGAQGIFRIQVNSPAGSILFVNNATNINNSVQFSSPIDSLTNLIVQLAHSDNTQVDLQGCEYTFSLKLTSMI